MIVSLDMGSQYIRLYPVRLFDPYGQGEIEGEEKQLPIPVCLKRAQNGGKYEKQNGTANSAFQ